MQLLENGELIQQRGNNIHQQRDVWRAIMLKESYEEANDAFVIWQKKKRCYNFMALSMQSRKHKMEDTFCAAVEKAK